jgi:hypothetical protein
MKRFIVLLPLIALVLVACSKTEEASAPTETPGTTASTEVGRPTTGAPEKTTETNTKTSEAEPKNPEVSVPPAPEKTEPTSTGSTAKEPTASADNDYVGHYKASRGRDADWVMYMLEMTATGDCIVKVMPATGKVEERKGKWKMAGGMATIEWPGESPMVLQLKGREMTATQFDKKNWPFERLIFYKRAS